MPERDDADLDRAIRRFDHIGTWSVCADGAMTKALQRGVESGRTLLPIDRSRLRRIHERLRGMVDKLDVRSIGT